MITENTTTTESQNANSEQPEKFIRWQKYTIDERGKLVSLLLSLALGTIAFIVNLVIKQDFSFDYTASKVFTAIGLIILLVCTMVMLFVTYNRLTSFSQTAQIANAKSKGKSETEINALKKSNNSVDRITKKSIKTGIILFMLGESFVIIGVFIEIIGKFI